MSPDKYSYQRLKIENPSKFVYANYLGLRPYSTTNRFILAGVIRRGMNTPASCEKPGGLP